MYYLAHMGEALSKVRSSCHGAWVIMYTHFFCSIWRAQETGEQGVSQSVSVTQGVRLCITGKPLSKAFWFGHAPSSLNTHMHPHLALPPHRIG